MLLMRRMVRYFERKMNDFKIWYGCAWKNHSEFKIPFFTRIKFAIKGFSVSEYVWFDLKNNNSDEYISDYVRLKSREINGPYKVILDNKVIFEEIFRNYTRVAETYAWINDGTIKGMHNNEVSENNIIDFLEKHKCVLKQIATGGGKGIFVIEYNDIFLVNGKPLKSDELKTFLLEEIKGPHIICEYIEQSVFAKSLFPDASNTIRIVCAKKNGETNCRIIKAVQRVGTRKSAPLDNVSKGAIACEIDLKTGELSAGTIPKTKNIENVTTFFESHPDTHCQLKGLKIPNWDELKTQIVEMTNQFPYLNFVAWDILQTNEGFCVIEGNASAGCTMFQMQHGIKNEEIGDIYRSYGIIER